MRISTLKSTTSLVMSFALVASPLAAQQTQDSDLPTCVGLEVAGSVVDGVALSAEQEAEAAPVLPCADLDGKMIVTEQELEAAIAFEAAEQADAGEIQTDPQALPGIIGDTAELPVELGTDGDLAEGSAEVEGAADAEANTALEAEIAAESDAGIAADVGADMMVEEQSQATDEAPTEIEAEMAAEAEAAQESAVADLAADLEAELEGDADLDAQAADGSDALEADAEMEVEAEMQADAAQDLPDSDGMPEGDDAAEIADLPVIAENTENSGVLDPVAPEQEAVAAAAAAEDDNMEPTAADEIEELTAEDVRSSDEDFDTSATGEARVQANSANNSSSSNSGSSNFEKALLLGLGAAVVGSILNNGDEVVSNSGDRVVVERNGELVVLKDDDVLLRQPGAQIQSRTFDDGSTRTIVNNPDGTRIITIRSNDGRVIRRVREMGDGSRVVLFDDTEESAPVLVTDIPQSQPQVEQQVSRADVETLRAALMADQRRTDLNRKFSLRQVRTIKEVRALAPEVELDTVTFPTGSAAIQPNQAEELSQLGLVMTSIIKEDPAQMFLVEGHTDAVGDPGYNLALSDRRAETVALALTEYFDVPPENLITQGYGESMLKIRTLQAERANRRASVRNITSLLR
ncbi:OmpA family protein [Loktanella agnita]|uniref:OmpA family protein n=1 Tax=Loktanella agnita TaxID=287097 RepID=UPI003989E409